MCKFGLVKNFVFITSVLLMIALSSTSCKKNKLITDPSAKVDFSADSVMFDTVFTTAGSTTRQIRVINNNNQRINISSINVQGGSSSAFFLNVDGSPGRSFSDIEIDANDSLFIFIQVNVNPNNSNSPLVISDAINFVVNGNTQTVYLEAWGQDAYYHKPTNAIKFINGGYLPYTLIAPGTNTTVTWPNDKPHVIYGWLVIDSSQTLVIDPGVKVHFHQNAGLWVYRYGTLKVQGAFGNEVVFQGDRLEPFMQDEPGQWDRIWINEGSINNSINYAIIKNGFIGVQTELLLGNFFTSPRRLKITNTKIQNMKGCGMYNLAFNVYGGNNVISNCKEYCLYMIAGGNCTFIHSTFGNYWTKDSRTTACVHIDNHSGTQQIPMDTCYFGNCIIDGSGSNELELDIITTATFTPKHKFSYCVIRTSSNLGSNPTVFVNCNPNGTQNVFNDPATYNFGLAANSIGSINLPNNPTTTGDAALFPMDITGSKSRSPGDGFPDAGAYER
jgi:hypothetical protein